MDVYHRARSLSNYLGSGLITGAADDDPSGIATYSQAGAAFGGGLLWTTVITTPLMIGIQSLSARIGWITGRGLAANMARSLPRSAAVGLVALLLIANTLNIAADIAAVAAAIQLIWGGSTHWWALGFGIVCAALPVWFSYTSLVRYLKLLTLTLLAYVAVLFLVKANWDNIVHDTWATFNVGGYDYWMMVVAVLGTTISPYMFFWQAAQEAELRQSIKADAVVTSNRLFAQEHLTRIKYDTSVGMLFSNVVAFCIMFSAAAAFYQNGITDIQTGRQAAMALEPVAGRFAFLLFSLGIISTGLLAVPVLAGSAAYAVADLFGWTSGLDHHYREAKGFYGVLIFATIGGALLGLSTIDPIKALVWSAVVNGIIAVPIMVVMMFLGSNRAILGDTVLSLRHRVIGWIATLIMLVAVCGLFVQWFKG